jgi:hypothetical protein
MSADAIFGPFNRAPKVTPLHSSSAGRRDRRALMLPPLRAVRLGAKRDPRPVSIP